MLRIISLFLVLIAGTSLFAQNNSNKLIMKNETAEDLRQLHELNAQFIQNFLHNDTAAHNKIIYKDFVCILTNGAVIDREDYMKEWAHGYDPAIYRSFTMQHELIRVFGSTALVRAETPYTIVKDGKEISGTTIYTDTYIKVDGKWCCVQAQLTGKK